MNYSQDLNNVNTIAIYLGNTCNFNCTYCDREYISESIGGQNFTNHHLNLLTNFFEQIYKESTLTIDRVALHGGEPFLYVKRMDQILERIKPYLDKYNLYVSITTNASLVLKEKEFVNKWSKYIRFTFSYDFIFQETNRESVEIHKVIDFCNSLDIPIHWQFVIPVTNKKAFSLELIKDIIDKVHRCKIIKSLNLIPLRHTRGKDKFEVYVDELDLKQFYDAFIRFVNTLYNYNIMVFIDGNYGKIDKNYLDQHYKIILSPDGFIYPEYDFCEYKTTEFQIGRWTDGLSPNFIPTINKKEYTNYKEKCNTCSSKETCGLKYLYSMFDREPAVKCEMFYKIIDTMVNYVAKLNSKPNFLTWINDGHR